MKRCVDEMDLTKISSPSFLKDLNKKQLEALAGEIRAFLIEKCSITGGHIGPNLGVVELTIALHKAFNSPKDKFLWDVGHQAYVHKILTGRASQFDTLRQYKGLCGFPKLVESEHDMWETGHSSTSLSAAMGMAAARDIKGDKNFVVPIIGGGIGEGILPISLGYSEILGKSAESFVGQLIPAAVIGNMVAIICAGLLKRLGEKKPELTGNGVLVKTKGGDGITEDTTINKPIDFSLMGAGLLIACSFFILGSLGSKFLGIPGPVLMIIAAALIKCIKLMPARMEQGAFHLYHTEFFKGPQLASLTSESTRAIIYKR